MTSQPMTAVERVAAFLRADPRVRCLTDVNLVAPDLVAALAPASEEVEKVAKGLVDWADSIDHSGEFNRLYEASALLRRLDAERGTWQWAVGKKDAQIAELTAHQATLTAELATLRAQAGEK